MFKVNLNPRILVTWLTLCVLGIVSFTQVNAQLYLNQFTGTGVCPTQGNSPVVSANATGAALSRDVYTCATANNVFNSSNLTLTAAPNASQYIEFSVSADPGYVLNLESLSFFRQGSNTAPSQLEVSYSSDNFATSTAWGSAPNTIASPGGIIAWDFPDFTTAPGGTVKFRFQAYGTISVNGGTPASGGTFRLDDVTVVGTVTSAGPSLSASSTSISFPNTNLGQQSVVQSFNVSANNLTGAPSDITVTSANADFEVSNDNISWGTTALIPYTSATLSSTPVYVRFSPQSVGPITGSLSFSGGGLTSAPTVSLSGTGTAVSVPTKLVITSIVPSSPIVNGTFDVSIQTQDATNIVQNVVSNTDIDLTVSTGTGTLLGVLSGTILAGTNTITLTGISYSVAESGVVISANRISGDVLSSGLSSPFTVLDIANQLVVVNAPTSGFVNTNLSTFTVEARRPDNTVDVNYTGAVTIAISSGPGTLSGTATVTAVAGVATFSGLQLNTPGTVVLEATASGLTSANTGGILISNAPSVTEIILPQYAINGTTTGSRLQYLSRLQLNDLLPNTTYRYSVGASTSNSITTATAPGNFWAINNTAGANGHIVGSTSNKSFTGLLMSGDEFSTLGRYAELTTDANGAYTGWFAFTPTGNAVFNDGSQVYVYVQLNNGAGGTAITTSLRTTNTVTMIAPITSARAVSGVSSALDENAIFLYDNTAGSGRPIYGTWAENDGITSNYSTWYAANVEGTGGAWGAYVPTALPNGIQRIEQRSIADGSLYGCAAFDADGVWAGAGNTVNPTSGTTPIVFLATDAPLDASPVGGTASGPATTSVGVSTAYNLSGHTGNIQWQEASSLGGPYSDISGETAATLNYTPVSAGTYYIRAKVSSASSYCEDFSNVVTTVANSANTTISITAFIQGYYTGSSTMQSTLFNQDGVSPATDCDNVTIELHSDLDYVPEYTTTAMLSTSGTATATFASAISGSYYVVLKHRNSLEVWSATAQSFPATNSYNFSTAGACYADGAGDTPTVEVASGVWASWSGDIDQDGYIDVLDYNIWDVEFAAGWPHTNYSPDLDGNGYVELDDYNIWDPNYQAGNRYTQRP